MNREEKIAELRKEFAELTVKKEYKVILDTSVLFQTFSLKWENDVQCTVDDSKVNMKPIFDDLENKIRLEVIKFNAKIKDFCDRCDAYAKELGEDPEHFFEDSFL